MGTSFYFCERDIWLIMVFVKCENQFGLVAEYFFCNKKKMFSLGIYVYNSLERLIFDVIIEIILWVFVTYT